MSGGPKCPEGQFAKNQLDYKRLFAIWALGPTVHFWGADIWASDKWAAGPNCPGEKWRIIVEPFQRQHPDFISSTISSCYSWNSGFSRVCDCFQISDLVSDRCVGQYVCQMEYLVRSKVCSASDSTNTPPSQILRTPVRPFHQIMEHTAAPLQRFLNPFNQLWRRTFYTTPL